jgi:hypothetical protein
VDCADLDDPARRGAGALIHGRATPEVHARLQDAVDLQGFDLNGRQHAIVTFRFAPGRQDVALAQKVTSRFLGEPLEGTTRGSRPTATSCSTSPWPRGRPPRL